MGDVKGKWSNVKRTLNDIAESVIGRRWGACKEQWISRTMSCSLWKKSNQPDPATTYDLITAVARQENENIRMDDISAEEICTAIKALKSYKAPGIDEINPELLNYGHDINVKQLMKLFNHIWKNENLWDDCTWGIIIKVPGKGPQWLQQLVGYHTCLSSG